MSADTNAVSAKTAMPVRLEKMTESHQGKNLFDGNFQLISGLKVRVSAFLGSAEILVGDLFALKEGGVIKLDSGLNEPVELLLDGKLIAMGSLVVVDDNFGIRVTEINDNSKS